MDRLPTQRTTQRLIAIALMIAVMSLWGSTFVVTKQTIADIPPLTLSFIRVSIGALVLLPFAIYRHRQGRRKPLPWGAIAALSAIGVAIYYVSFNLALSMTSASQGALVQSCIPTMTALAAIFMLRERASRSRLLGIALSITGIFIVFSGGSGAVGTGSAGVLGNLLMFASVVAWGIYTALAKRVAEYDSVVITACIVGGGALMLLPLAALEINGRPLPVIGVQAWAGLVYLGALASGVAFLIYNYALRYMDAGQAGVFANLIPIVGVLSGMAVLHEPLSMRAILGGVVVMLGVGIASAEKPALPINATSLKAG